MYSSLFIIPNRLPQELELQEAIQRDPEYQTKFRTTRDAEDRSKGDSSFTRPSGAGTQVAAGGAPRQTPCKPPAKAKGASVPSGGWTSFLLTQLVKDRASEILGSHNKKGESYTEKEVPPFFRVDT